MHEIKIISLAIAFFSPLAWALTYLFDGFKGHKSRIYLFFLMLSASLTYFFTYTKFSGNLDIYSYLFFLQVVVSLCLFPLFFLYIKSLTSENKLELGEILPHFIFPFSMFLTYFIFQKFLMSREEEKLFMNVLLDIDDHQNILFITGKVIYDIGKVIYVIISILYFVYSVKYLRKHYKKVQDIYPDDDTKELKWFKTIGILVALLTLFFSIIHLMKNSKVASNELLVTVSYLVFAIFFWFLGLYGFRQADVFDYQEVIETETFEVSARISRDDIEEYIEKHKPYRNRHVSVFDFCYHFHTNRTYLSESIKTNFGTNFRGLINQYRIKEVIQRINDLIHKNTDINLEEIAIKSGFSSYNTFLRVFKSEMQITPSEYIEKKLLM